MHKSSAKEIITRLKGLLGVKTDQELADKIEVPLGTILSWKGRGTIPADRVLSICYFEDLRPAYVLFGEGSPEFEHQDESLDKNAIAIAIEIGFEIIKNQKAAGEPISDFAAREYVWAAVLNNYSDIINQFRFLRESGLYKTEKAIFEKILADRNLASFQWWKRPKKKGAQ